MKKKKNWILSLKHVQTLVASPDISYFLGSADSSMNIHLSVLNYRNRLKI